MTGFVSAVRGEVACLRHRAAPRVSLLVWALCLAGFAYAVAYLATNGSPLYDEATRRALIAAMLPQGVPGYVFESLPMYGAPQFAILGAVIGAADLARGTIRTVAARFRNRVPLAAARAMTVLLLGVAAAVTSLVACLVSSLVLVWATGREWSWPALGDLAVSTLACWLVATCFIALGLCAGVATRSVLAGVVLVVSWALAVEALLIGMLAPSVQAIADLRGLLPVGATSSLGKSLAPSSLMLTSTTGPWVAVAVLVVWTTAALAAAGVLLSRRDLA